MNINQAKGEIIHTVKAYLNKDEDGEYTIPSVRQRPILLMGPPGIGKTQVMEQVARECRIGLVSYTITHHTRQSAVGLPYIKEEKFEDKTYSVTEYTMSEIIASVYKKMRESGLREGILFIDEINCVSETLAPTMLAFLQCKTFGNQKIPDGWIIAAAGNPPEYNKSVRDFDMVTLDRVRRIDIEADYRVWREYAAAKKLNPSILSYLELRPKNFYRIEADVDGMEYVTARGWEDLCALRDVYEQLGIDTGEEIIYEFIRHKEIAQDVAAYIDLYKKYRDDYGINDILAGNVKSQIYARLLNAQFDERITVVNMLNDGLKAYFSKVAQDKYIADKWYEFLKAFKSKMKSDIKPYDVYMELINNKKKEIETGKKAGFYQKVTLGRLNLLVNKITQACPSQDADSDKAFEQARNGFEIMRNELESDEKITMTVLENAFDFCEDAFSDKQEMVVFVTELTMNPESAMYLAQHLCERYLEYNEKLLIGTQRQQILSELE